MTNFLEVSTLHFAHDEWFGLKCHSLISIDTDIVTQIDILSWVSESRFMSISSNY